MQRAVTFGTPLPPSRWRSASAATRRGLPCWRRGCLGVPCVVMEQNAVAGLTQRALLGSDRQPSCDGGHALPRFACRARPSVLGNPVRADLVAGARSCPTSPQIAAAPARVGRLARRPCAFNQRHAWHLAPLAYRRFASGHRQIDAPNRHQPTATRGCRRSYTWQAALAPGRRPCLSSDDMAACLPRPVRPASCAAPAPPRLAEVTVCGRPSPSWCPFPAPQATTKPPTPGPSTWLRRRAARAAEPRSTRALF